MKVKKLDELGVSAFCESMGMMVQAGITTDEAISLLQRSGEHAGGVLETALAQMKEKVDEGVSLANAMKETDVFPDYALRMIEAGEQSGRLEDILFRLSGYGVVGVATVLTVHVVSECGQLLSCFLCFFLFCLSFAYSAYCVFYLGIAFPDK